MRKINKIIVHCSGTPEFRDFNVEDIRAWHVDGNGWSDIGYHYVIKLDGEIQPGRLEKKIGAHCYRNNRSSIGLCYIGGMNKNMTEWKDTRTNKQKQSLLNLINELKEKYPGAIVYGHKDFTNKKLCPSFDAKEEYK
jgi:N-acetylmuramoyl-L-alanine amidase|tara:strand:+ start:645 stop:1055 length:411 start_codon:yes stop_codon:yes gene_type:complete